MAEGPPCRQTYYVWGSENSHVTRVQNEYVGVTRDEAGMLGLLYLLKIIQLLSLPFIAFHELVLFLFFITCQYFLKPQPSLTSCHSLHPIAMWICTCHSLGTNPPSLSIFAFLENFVFQVQPSSAVKACHSYSPLNMTHLILPLISCSAGFSIVTWRLPFYLVCFYLCSCFIFLDRLPTLGGQDTSEWDEADTRVWFTQYSIQSPFSLPTFRIQAGKIIHWIFSQYFSWRSQSQAMRRCKHKSYIAIPSLSLFYCL